MNIYDISEKAGVSIATVSRVLNGNSKVSEKTRQKIMNVIEETGYQPNVFARGLGLNTMNTVGILCADCSDIVLASAVYHVEHQLRQYKYDSLLSCTGYDPEMKRQCTEMLLSKRVDALIYVGSNFVYEEEEKNQYIIDAAQKVPVMIINGYLEAPNVYCIISDDSEVLESIAEKFLLENRKLLYLCRLLSNSGIRKVQGIRQALVRHGAELSEDNFMQVNASIREICEELKSRWNTGVRWDAVIAADDELAIAAYKFALQEGLRVPEDIQIVGYNNSTISICCEPELTTIENYLSRSSEVIVDNLMKIFAGEGIEKRIVVKAELVIRGTTSDL